MEVNSIIDTTIVLKKIILKWRDFTECVKTGQTNVLI